MKGFLFLLMIIFISCEDLFSQSVESVSDSVESLLDSFYDREHYEKFISSPDSIEVRYQSYQNDIKEEQISLQLRIDSLKSAGLSYDIYSVKLDSLTSVRSFSYWKKNRDAIIQSQGKLNGIKNTDQRDVNNRIDLFLKEAIDKDDLPADINVPDINLSVGQLNLPDLSNAEPGTFLPSRNDLNIGANIKSLGGIDKKIDVEKLDVPKADLPRVKTPDVGDVSEKVSGYSKDIKRVKEGDLSKVDELGQDAVSKLPVEDELKVLKDGDKVMTEQKALIESMKKPEEYKRQTLARARQVATKQLAVHQEVVRKMVNKVSAYQQNAGTVLAKSKDLPKRRDPLKKLKTYERLVPGLTVQIQKPGGWLVDFNPSLRYRMTSYWSAGAGWSERFIFGHYSQTREQARVYGVRGFTEVVVFKGLAVRLDAEQMNTFVVPAQQNRDLSKRRWIWNYMAGVKKEFTFMPRVVGNVQFMYNLYDPHDRSGYANRVNVRFGFEFPLRGKVR